MFPRECLTDLLLNPLATISILIVKCQTIRHIDDHTCDHTSDHTCAGGFGAILAHARLEQLHRQASQE